MRKSLSYSVLSTLSSFIIFASSAQANPEIATHNRSPLVSVQGGMPNLRPQPEKGFDAALNFEIASISTDSADTNENILLDGESNIFTLALNYGVSDRLSLTATLPWYRHSGGNLDSLISNWHDLWGLPQGNRDQLPDDQLRYEYARTGQPLYSFSSATSGIGDLALGVNWQLSGPAQRTWSLQSQIHLPTGDAQKLTGTDANRIYLGAAYAGAFSNTGRYQSLSFSLRAGAMWLEKGEIPVKQEEIVYMGRAAVRWQWLERLALKAQLDAHTAYYDSGLRELGHFSTQLSLGGEINLTKNWSLDLFFSEDTSVDTAADIVFGASLLRSFH